MSTSDIYDVAIVGYGPVGQVAAGLLGQRGFKVYVCERMPDVHQIPRAISLDHEIMRVFQQLGVVEAVEPYIEPFTNSEYLGADGQLIRRMTMVAPPYPQGYTPSMVFTQPPVERALRARVAQLPNVTVDLGVEMGALAQDPEGVMLQIGSGGQARTVRARYCMACDGGSSGVRTQLGIEMQDLDFDEPWLVVDVLVNERGLAKLPKVSVQYCEPQRPCTLVIGPKNHRRWEISILPGEDPVQVATAEHTWQLLSRWLTPDDGQLWRQASYRFHALVAQQWRHGRVFLAGDAAHMQPPFLGQGMCQGVRDVANLSWKLAAVLQGEVRGDAGEALLDSYGTERRAHVRELTSRIKGVGAVICERDVAKARARDARLLEECAGQVQDTPRQDILPRLEDGFLSGQASAARGGLFPQPWLTGAAGARQRMDELAGHGWRLVLAPGVERAGDASIPGLTVVALGSADDVEGVAAHWFQRHGCVAALLRPDNYVYGVAGAAAEAAALCEEAAAALGASACIA
ncbi:bifunctional 3-(3-hydroxy-phenyl)propionate/3-hydroxycinnamic acid hydroxylase [Variovorax sp. NFACC27]|uniref:bifunctional 3-(3-hydroxy-phenyl)propionate/3-hydroxycinnamic acid hydroxylase n=1 Tax=unclassified Variovorax TaxID=663243 RepID=UPI000895064B|nr:3-(3-hydroxy-phenyl)propionate hydroxylase [Variovorax paradoxus]SEF34682.1 3-(3-hydroxy-phenyl)propionate hydroxylase [Variovorax sp. NFACC28]SEG97675.1 3-(3-hydroxy-phenyl)propionate hydroxylase [Variovorax sp. NFACC29]SFD99469.1 3-(3-hydroxy-phenyl)propionate hydroxylase [Variovorax sp. NFACC26]SFH25191.1 3-(3-hydroxy-phenyl)propionate hydroxylase [Variovorax sp. NFACC27]